MIDEEHYKQHLKPIADELGIPVEYFWRNAIDQTFNGSTETIGECRTKIEIASLRDWIKGLKAEIERLTNVLPIQEKTDVWNDWSQDHQPEIGCWIEWIKGLTDNHPTRLKRTDVQGYSLWRPVICRLGVDCWNWTDFEHWGQWRYCDSPQQENKND